VLAATVARARGDPRARRDEKAKPACREEEDAARNVRKRNSRR